MSIKEKTPNVWVGYNEDGHFMFKVSLYSGYIVMTDSEDNTSELACIGLHDLITTLCLVYDRIVAKRKE